MSVSSNPKTPVLVEPPKILSKWTRQDPNSGKSEVYYEMSIGEGWLPKFMREDKARAMFGANLNIPHFPPNNEGTCADPPSTSKGIFMLTVPPFNEDDTIVKM